MLKETLQKCLKDITDIRHQIHSQPELANQENQTAAFVADILKKQGYQVTTNVGGTGLYAILDSGKQGKTVALRADMDALPIQEQTNLPYRSKNAGKMHACGHDGHTATLLAAAMALKECKHEFKGKIKFIFQPAEEIGAGAPAMIKQGILDHVDAIFGYHNMPGFTAGAVVVKPDCIMAGQDTFTITVKGRGGHAARPETVIDPIYIASNMVQALQSIVSRNTSPTEPLVISVTQFHAGNTYNIIPDEAVFIGTIRTVTAATQKKVQEQMTQIMEGIASAFGASVKVDFYNHFSPTVNHREETELVIATATRILNETNVKRITVPSMVAEDFSCYLEKIPGCFFFVGNGDSSIIHSARYIFNDEIIGVAAEMLAQVAIDYLR